MSHMVGVDWASLAGLLNIPYSQQEEIRANHKKYPDSYSKAQQILALFNGSREFDRDILERYFDEMGRADVKDKMHPVQNKVFNATIFLAAIEIVHLLLEFRILQILFTTQFLLRLQTTCVLFCYLSFS